MSLKGKVTALLLAAVMLLSNATVVFADRGDTGTPGDSVSDATVTDATVTDGGMLFTPLLLGAAPASVYVNGVALTSGQYLPSNSKTVQASAPSSGGYAYFDGSKLTLQDFTCACTSPYGTLMVDYQTPAAAIFADGDLDIVLVGASTVSAVDSDGIAAAICVGGELTFSGSGTASFTGTTKSDADWSYGIAATGRVSFTGSGAVTVSSGRAWTNAGSTAFGIYCGGLTVAAGAAVTAKVTGSDVSHMGEYIAMAAAITSSGDIFIDGTLHALTCKSGALSQGIVAPYNGSNITISGGAKVTVESLCSVDCLGIIAAGTVTLSAGVTTSITLGAAGASAVEAASIDCPANTTVTGGEFYNGNKITANAAKTLVEIHCGSEAKLSFSCENGTTLPERKVDADLELPSPAAWKNYTFEGWYSAPNGEDAETSPFTGKLTEKTARELTASCKVYAHWKNNGKTVLTRSFELNPDNIENAIDAVDTYTSLGYKWETINGKNTLTLNGFTMENAFLSVYKVDAVIINGENHIYGKADSSYGVLLLVPVSDDGTIELSQGGASGSLYVEVGSSQNGSSTAITVYGGTLCVNSGSLTAIGGTGTHADSCGISGTVGKEGRILGAVTNHGGTITAKGGAGANSFGIRCAVTNLSGKITATGGAADYSYGIFGAVTNHGTLSATGGAADFSYGICGEVTNDGGTLTAKGGAAQAISAGICLEGYGAEVKAAGGTIHATGGSGEGAQSESYGIYGKFKNNKNYVVTVSSGTTLDAAAGSATGKSVGVMTNQLNTAEGAHLSASCENSAPYHASAVYSDGSIGDADITGAAIYKSSDACEFTVYSDDSFAQMPLFALVGSFEVIDEMNIDKATALRVNAGAELTIGSGAKLALPGIAALTNEGAVVHNGTIYLTGESLSGEALASAIAKKGLRGSGRIISGGEIYLCDGSSAEDALLGDITVSDQDDTAHSEVYSYDNETKQLTVNAGKTIVGNIILQNQDTTVLLGDGVTILGNIVYDNAEGSLVISVPVGKTAVVNGNIIRQYNEQTYDLALRSGALRVNGYVSCNALDIVMHSRLEVNHAESDSSPAVHCGDLTVAGILIADNVNGEIGVRANNVQLKRNGSIEVGCRIGLYATGSEGFTMERGSQFIADTDDAQGIALITYLGGINLLSSYLPRGCAFTSGGMSGQIQTLARSGATLTTGGVDSNSVTFSMEECENIIHDVVIEYHSSDDGNSEGTGVEAQKPQQQEPDKIVAADAESSVVPAEQTEAEQSLPVEGSDAKHPEAEQSLPVEGNDAEQPEAEQSLPVEDGDAEQAKIPVVIYAVAGGVLLVAVVGVCLYKKRKTKV